MFYDRYISLCKERGISPSRCASEIGLNKASVTNWKKNGYTPRADVLQRIADYFGVSMAFLMGAEASGERPGAEGELNVNTIEYALYGEARELDEEEKKQLLELAKLMRRKRREMDK